MSTYTNYDFSASLARERDVQVSNIKTVLAAWGNVGRDGACCDACGGEWSGGFLMALKDGKFAYLSGWCDYTGWGCQDGTKLQIFDAKPKLDALESIPIDKWDIKPIDLNKWLKDDGKLPEVY